MRTPLNLKNCLTVLLAGCVHLAFPAATNDRLTEKPIEVLLFNNTNAPAAVWYTNEGQKESTVAANKQISLGLGNTLERILYIQPESRTTGWAPSFIAKTLTAVAYPKTSYDIAPLFNQQRTPQKSSQAIITINRSGIGGLDLTLKYTPIGEALREFQEKLKALGDKIYLKNDWDYAITVFYDKIRKLTLESKQEVPLLNLEDPNITITPLSKYGTDSPTAGIFYSPRSINIAELQAKRDLQDPLPFFDIIDEKEYRIVLPEDNSWNLYISEKR